jgi:polar amino acid transport system permease protein
MDEITYHFLNFNALWQARLVLLEGALGTLKLGFVTLLFAPLCGILVLAPQLAGNRALRVATEWYIDVIRAFPLLVFLVVAYYLLLPILGLSVDPFLAAAVAFALKHGVYFAEIYRSGWLSVDRGQFLASESIGLTRWHMVRHVILPQMLLVIMPAMTSQATLIMRDLPLAFIIGYFEILTSARASQVFTHNSTPLLGAVVAYAVTLLLLQWVTRRVESVARRRMEA